MCPEGNAGSLPFIWVRFRNRTLRCLPPLPARRPMREPHISPKGRKVYMAFQPARFIRSSICIGKPCALTAHFHPYPEKSGRLFSVTLSVPDPCRDPPFRWCGALCCPDFPPRPNPEYTGRDKGGRAVCSFSFFSVILQRCAFIVFFARLCILETF